MSGGNASDPTDGLVEITKATCIPKDGHVFKFFHWLDMHVFEVTLSSSFSVGGIYCWFFAATVCCRDVIAAGICLYPWKHHFCYQICAK